MILPPSKDAIEALRRQGKMRAEIAAELQISLARLKRLIAEYGVAPRQRREAPPPPPPPPPAAEARTRVKPFAHLPLMEQCQQILGKRMREDHRGYVLDGRPASSTQVLAAAGLRVRRSA